MNNLLNPANPISPLNPINPASPLHTGLFKSPSDTLYNMAAATSSDIPMFVLGMFLGIVFTLIIGVFIFLWKKG